MWHGREEGDGDYSNLAGRRVKRAVRTACSILALVVLAVFSASAQWVDLDTGFYTPPGNFDPYPMVEGDEVRNIILMIGDGMGLATVTAARIEAVGPVGRLYMEKFPVIGLAGTHPTDRLVTDSGASATAIATGHKTTYGYIGVTPDGEPVKSILEYARDHGLATGLVVTTYLAHATPAGFFAHVADYTFPYRKTTNPVARDIIAEQMVNCGANVLLGGGRGYMIPASKKGSFRKDEKDLLKQMKEAGYTIVESRKALMKADGEYVLGLFADKEMDAVPDPSLEEMTARAIELLNRDEDGFFLMVEGSQIDYFGHDNVAAMMIKTTLLFDLAVREAVEFARHDGRTLVIVTADHETGGVTIIDSFRQLNQLHIRWSTDYHTGVQVPVYVYGPGAQRFAGVLDNTDIFRRMAELAGFEVEESAFSEEQAD